MSMNSTYDLLIIGGGINGTGIAADAAGRGLSVLLCEQDDLAFATSSWSTKLIHGGLRYLEHYEFKLVHEALNEREVLLKKAPFLIYPLEFILPHDSHLRPAWMIRIGLFLYDYLGRRVTIPKSKKVNLLKNPAGDALANKFSTGFSYYDCRTDDSRLTVLNALAAKQNHATILTRTRCISAKRQDGLWQVTLQDQHTQTTTTVTAKALINTTGPWVVDVLQNVVQQPSPCDLKLVKGSHIIIPKLYDGEFAYILQNPDQRIIFAIPYLNQFTLVGTTDVDFEGDPNQACISDAEIHYLCENINRYFQKQIKPADIVWDYSGVRPLFSPKNVKDPSKVTREYHFELNDQQRQAPILSVFGGKITTFRKLAEHALEELSKYFPNMKPAWTSTQPLPGGNLNGLTVDQYLKDSKEFYTWLPDDLLHRYFNAYGSRMHDLLENTQQLADLGQHFGAGLYEKEVNFLINQEWAQTADDILWRRSKLGLFLSDSEKDGLIHFINHRQSV